MLTGDETVTSGNAFVGGSSVITNLSEAQQNLGWFISSSTLIDMNPKLTNFF